MSTNIKDAKSTSSFTPMEAGTYPAVCCGVIDLGLQKTSFEGKEREVNQILIIWEFPSETIECDGEQKPRWLSTAYTFSVNEKSKLRKDLRSWRGRDFTDQELSDFDIKNVLGAPCIITVSQVEKNGNVYSNISGIGKLMKGMHVPPPSKSLYFNMDDTETWESFPDIPEWIQTKINNSLTLKNRGIQISKTGEIFNVGTQSTPATGFWEIDEDESDLPF